MFIWPAFALFMFLMVTTTPWPLVSDWSKLYMVLKGIISPHQNGKCRLPLIFSAKFMFSWTSALTTIFSSGRQLPVAISCSYAPESLRYSTRSALTPHATSTWWRHFSSVHGRSALLDGAHHETVENWPTTPGSDPLYTHTHHSVYPACAMKSNLALQRSRPNMSEEWPLFLLENNQALTKQQLVTFVSHLLRLIGVDSTAYGTHSFRIGGATSASLAGLADYEI